MGIVLEGADPHPGVFATLDVLRDPAPISFGVFTKFDVLREALRGAKSTTFGGGGFIQALPLATLGIHSASSPLCSKSTGYAPLCYATLRDMCSAIGVPPQPTGCYAKGMLSTRHTNSSPRAGRGRVRGLAGGDSDGHQVSLAGAGNRSERPRGSSSRYTGASRSMKLWSCRAGASSPLRSVQRDRSPHQLQSLYGKLRLEITRRTSSRLLAAASRV
jgi:hypothetical protein